jgi:hypothetical protein
MGGPDPRFGVQKQGGSGSKMGGTMYKMGVSLTVGESKNLIHTVSSLA